MMLFSSMYWDSAGLAAAGLAIGYGLCLWRTRQHRSLDASAAKSVLDQSRREADTVVREARLLANEEAVKSREQSEKALNTRRSEIAESERRLAEREDLVNRQLAGLMEQERELRQQQQGLQKKFAEVDTEHALCVRLNQQRQEQLQQLTRLSISEARQLLLKEVEQEAHRDADGLTRRIVEEAKLHAEEQARRIITVAIERYACDHTFETTTSTVTLQSDEIKGRIIGREGRNIRAFEAATGVTVLIDDTPNAVVLSGFDPVRREIARVSMQNLIQDGRIHPTRIEEIVAKVTQEIDEGIRKAGEEAVFKLRLAPMHREVARLLGRLRFRCSFSQNILDHSIEVAQLTGLMAAELRLNIEFAKRAGVLHDIGKAIDHEVEGSHALIGSEFIKRYGEPEEVIIGVASHHDEAPQRNVYGVLVAAADAISASRPGARSESMTTYLKRLENLEQIGSSFPGVEKCFAVQAGRELRVIVQPEAMDDHQSYILARTIARKIESDLQYPGQIRITVVRETRCVEYAK